MNLLIYGHVSTKVTGLLMIMAINVDVHLYTGGSRLSWIFWEHANPSGLSVLIGIKLIKLYKNEIIQKIRAMQESGLTAVWLKRDPPVFNI